MKKKKIFKSGPFKNQISCLTFNYNGNFVAVASSNLYDDINFENTKEISNSISIINFNKV